MTQVEVTVGWSKSRTEKDPVTGREFLAYSSFSDGYRPEEQQHTESMVLEVPEHWTAEQVAETVFMATNQPSWEPEEGTPEAQVLAALKAAGYRGQGAHYSLSTGDTVTVDGVMVECGSFGWKRVGGVNGHVMSAMEQVVVEEYARHKIVIGPYFNLVCECGHHGEKVSEPGEYEQHVSDSLAAAVRQQEGKTDG